jgi:hypothetical protein
MEAAIGFEPMHGGFADLSLNHLGTPPRRVAVATGPNQQSIAGHAAPLASSHSYTVFFNLL